MVFSKRQALAQRRRWKIIRMMGLNLILPSVLHSAFKSLGDPIAVGASAVPILVDMLWTARFLSWTYVNVISLVASLGQLLIVIFVADERWRHISIAFTPALLAIGFLAFYWSTDLIQQYMDATSRRLDHEAQEMMRQIEEAIQLSLREAGASKIPESGFSTKMQSIVLGLGLGLKAIALILVSLYITQSWDTIVALIKCLTSFLLTLILVIADRLNTIDEQDSRSSSTITANQ
ncbi:hypothetical protein EDD86DRAFT_203153 [Gorgonomyces haynaldii]|nr:hypothetical protein EDD86DRAFT_203153 [Gorgonomyces haynaldii]